MSSRGCVSQRRVDAMCLKQDCPTSSAEENRGLQPAQPTNSRYSSFARVSSVEAAMKQHKKPDTASGTTRDHFRTPRRPSPQSSFKTSKSTTSKRTTSPGVSTSGRSRKRSSLPSSYRAQSTLTQIDFVTQTPHSDDDELNYIDNTGETEDGRKAEQPVQISDLSDGPECRPSLRGRPALSTLGMNDDHPKRRRKSTATPRAPLHKSQTPRLSGGRGKRKSTDKPPAKRDKTLTQMDFVRRYITIDDDDDNNDVNLGYIQPASQDDSKENGQNEDMGKPNKVKPEPAMFSSKRNRMTLEAEVDLYTGEPISQSEETQSPHKRLNHSNPPKSEVPITPQKPRRLEIPSSQSPESPGLAIITSSQFRSATRSPQKKARLNIFNPEHSINEESTDAPEMAENSAERGAIQHQSPPHSQSIDRKYLDPKQASSRRGGLPSVLSSTEASQQPAPTDDGPPQERTQRERTVIYETDAETDSDLEDAIGTGFDTPIRPHDAPLVDSNLSHGRSQSPIDDSQDLPLPSAHTCADLDSAPASEDPMSDASMFYQRVQPATQFPHEPIPTLNTQKLSELFPNEGSTQHPRQRITQQSPRRPPLSFLPSQTRTQSKATDQVEIVPESSPARDEDEGVFQRPRPPGSVVQVESSQPIERGPATGNILSRSQLLTSSVMESIPMPNFWLGSQESVGEPYSP